MLSDRTTIVRHDYHERLLHVMSLYTVNLQKRPKLFKACEDVLLGDTSKLCFIFMYFNEYGLDNIKSQSALAVIDALFSRQSFQPLFENGHPSQIEKTVRYNSLMALTYTKLVRKDIMQIIMKYDDYMVPAAMIFRYFAAMIFRYFYEKTRSGNLEKMILLLRDSPLDRTLLGTIISKKHFLLEIWECFQDVMTEADIPNILQTAQIHIPAILLSQIHNIPKHLRTQNVLTQICQLLQAHEYAQFTGLINTSVYKELVDAFFPLLPIFRLNNQKENLLVRVDNGSPFSFELVLLIAKYYPTTMPYAMREVVINGLQQLINAITVKCTNYRDAVKKFLVAQAPASVLFQPPRPARPIPPALTTAEPAPAPVTTKKKRTRKPRPLPTYQPEKEVITLSNRFALLK